MSVVRSRSAKYAQKDVSVEYDRLPASPPGLLNRCGLNNCFLNSLVQCLWHCRDFRDCLLALPAAVVKGTVFLPRHLSVQASFV